MIPEINPYNNWSGNGSTTTFDFDFYIEDETQLVVYHTDADGNQTTLTYNTDYSVNEFENENGSYITFPLSASSYDVLGEDEVLSLCLTLPIEQQNPYGKSSYLNLETLEYSLDYLTRICQILARGLERCLKMPEGSSTSVSEYLEALMAETLEEAKSTFQTVVDELESEFEEFKTYINTTCEDVLEAAAIINALVEAAQKAEEVAALLENFEYRIYYKPFCVNTGEIDSNGRPSFLTLADDILTAEGSYDVTTADGTCYTVTDTITFDINSYLGSNYAWTDDYEDESDSAQDVEPADPESDLSDDDDDEEEEEEEEEENTYTGDGTHYIFINPVDLTMSASMCSVTADIDMPADAQEGDYLLNNARVPFDLWKKTSDGIETGLNDVLAGCFTVEAGEVASLYVYQYNHNIMDDALASQINTLSALCDTLTLALEEAGVDLSSLDLENYVTETELANALDGYMLTSDLSDYYTKDETDALLEEKQDVLTFDTTPAEGSTNPVTSDGIYNALADVDVDLSNYYTKDEVDALLGLDNYVTYEILSADTEDEEDSTYVFYEVLS